MLTPIPALLGFSDRRWWVFRVAERLDFRVTPETAALVLLVLYAVAALVLQRWAERAYRALREDPEIAGSTARLRAGDQELVAAEAGSYSAGFANPVWTRELRTRLRGKEAPQFIFFASTALALGGFTPLVSAASQLGDPLETARVAREVFFDWLSMTLAALMVLVAPGLSAEAIHSERARGALELLLTTPMKRSRILEGKLLGDLSVLGLLVSPSLPLLGFAISSTALPACRSWASSRLSLLRACCAPGTASPPAALQTRSMAAKWQAYLLSLASCGFFGGPLWIIGTLATAHGETALASSDFVWLSPLLMSFYGFLLAVLWSPPATDWNPRSCEGMSEMNKAASPRFSLLITRYSSLVGLLILVWAVMGRLSTVFLEPENLLEMTRHMVEVGLVALPMTLVILTAGIDLSPGSTMGLASVILGLAWRGGLPIAAAAGSLS